MPRVIDGISDKIRLLEAKVKRKPISIIDEVFRLKSSIYFTDEFGTKKPLLISVVIPTFIKSTQELTGYRSEVLMNALLELGLLVRKGIIDEIIVVDGTNRYGAIDNRLMGEVISTADHVIPLFHDIIGLIRKYPIVKNEAQLGLYNLVVKVIHQLDPKINSAYEKLQIPPHNLSSGKGTALWLATGIASGDIIVFLDSDVRNFQRWQATALMRPILKSWHKSKPIKCVKAYYTRLKVNIDWPEKGLYSIGGRVTRLFVRPLIRILSKHGVLRGLEKLEYPLSGEFAARKECLESLAFTSNYGFEMSTLIQIWRRDMLDQVSQVDLRLFQHFPQRDKNIREMVIQIAELIVDELKDSIEFDKVIIDEYVEEAMQEIQNTEHLYDQADIRREVQLEVRRDFVKDTEGAKRRVKIYAESLKKVIQNSKKNKRRERIVLPPWNGLSSQKELEFRAFLKRRAIRSTLELLDKQGLIKLE